jgi:hypothetical protein
MPLFYYFVFESTACIAHCDTIDETQEASLGYLQVCTTHHRSGTLMPTKVPTRMASRQALQ